MQEVLELLTVIEKLAGHPAQFTHIRKVATDRLNELDVEYNSNPQEEEQPAEEPGEAEDNPAPTTRDEEEEDA